MADNDVRIRIRVSDETREGLRAARAGLRDVRSAASDAGGVLGSMFGSLGAAATSLAAIGSATGGIQGLVAAVTNLAGAALVLPGAFAAGASALAAFQIGTSGVMDALNAKPAHHSGGGGGSSQSTAISNAKALRSANDAVAASQRGIVTASKQVESAQRGVAAAERAVVDAEHQAAAASRAYQDALRSEQRAQEDVTRARADAERQLQDAAEAAADAQRGEEGASISLRRAQENLIKVQKDVKHTALDLEEAQYQVEVAQDGVTDAQTSATRATEDNNAAQAKGVDGADNVVAANDALAQAHQSVADAAYAVTQAQQGVADANQGVADANDQLADAQQGVLDAQHAADEAAQNLADTLAQQAIKAGAAAGGIDAYAQALAKLSPNARDFVLTLKSLAPAWDAVKNSVQDRMFEGLAGDVKDLAKTYLPVLKDGLGGIADQFNSMARYAVKALLDPAAVGHINSILGNTASFLDKASTAVGDLITGFLGLADTGSGFLPDFGQWIAEIAKQFKDWVTQNPDQIKQFIKEGLQGFRDLKDIIGNVVRIFTGLFGGGNAQDGKNFLGTIKDITKWLADIAPTVGHVLPILALLWLTKKAIDFGKAVFGVFREIGRLADRLGPRIARAFSSGPAKVLGGVAAVGLGAVAADAVIPKQVGGSIAGVSSQHQRDELSGIADAVKDPGAALQQLKDQFAAFPAEFDQSPFMTFWRGFPDWWTGIWASVGQAFADWWTIQIQTPVSDGVANVQASLGLIFQPIIDGAQTASLWVSDRITDIQTWVGGMVDWFQGLDPWGWITSSASTAAQWIYDRVTDIQDRIGRMVDWFQGLDPWGWIQGGLRAASNGAIGLLNGLIRGLNTMIQGLNAVNPFGQIGYVPYVSYLAKGGVASGRAIVGENGPELVDLPAGSRVRPAGDTQRELAKQAAGQSGGGGGAARVTFAGNLDSAFATAFMNLVRTNVIQIQAA